MSNYNRAPQNANNFVIFDFETSGVNLGLNDANAVTEIALLSIDGGSLKQITEYQSLIAPYKSDAIYDDKAAKVSGISFDLVAEEGVDIREVAEQTIVHFEKTNNRQEKSPGLKPVLVGHNVGFDINALHHLLYYGFKGTTTDYQKELERVLHGRRDFYGNFQPSYMDTWSLFKSWFQGDKELLDYKLGTVMEKLGIDLNNAHRAMNDVVSTTEGFRKVLSNLRSSYINNYTGGREGFYFPIRRQ